MYCDSSALESHWFNWLISEATPELEPARERGLLYTKTKDNKNPNVLAKSHCLACEKPIYFNSYASSIGKPVVFNGCKPVTTAFPDFGRMVAVNTEAIVSKGYFKEEPASRSWEKLALNVQAICSGISKKFTLPSPDYYEDLANDAMLQVLTKMKARKLIYTPGRAPVFNLLTMTVHRIIFSILKTNKRRRDSLAQTNEHLKRIISGLRGKQPQPTIVRRYCGCVSVR